MSMRLIVPRLVVGTLAIAVISGCSSRAVHSGRMGLFDRMKRYPAAHHQGAGSDKEDVVGSGPEAEQIVAKWHEVRRAAESWRWPLDHVEVRSPFGRRGADFHEGIDLKAPSGTPVYAVQTGRVIYAGKKIGGYGNMVIIRHPGGLSSIYAHNSKLLVKKGQRVYRGQEIAEAGNTGRSSGPHLHFEVRSGVTPVDPIRLLAVRTPKKKELDRKLATSK